MEQFENHGNPNPDNHMPVSTISRGTKFVQNYLGFVVMGVFLLSNLIALTNIASLSLFNLILRQFWPLGIISVGTVAATRIKGPDLSMAAMMGLSSAMIAFAVREDSISAGIIGAIVLCLFFGMLNGALISFLGVPSIVLTIVTAAMMRFGILTLVSPWPMLLEGLTRPGEFQFFLMLIIAVALALAALAITKRLPMVKDEKKRGSLPKLMNMFGYALVAIIAGIAGYAMLRNFNVMAPSIQDDIVIRIILIFAAVQSSKLLKNNIIALGYGLGVTLIIAMSSVVRIWLHMPHFFVDAAEAGLAIWLICVACAANGGWRSVLNANLETMQ